MSYPVVRLLLHDDICPAWTIDGAHRFSAGECRCGKTLTLTVNVDKLCIYCHGIALGECEACEAPICSDCDGKQYADVMTCAERHLVICNQRIDRLYPPETPHA